MVISHKHKYVFIQLDRTASSAIAKELVKLYDGEHILWKHARYCDFLAQASKKEKKYFSFSGVRNPLDVAVTEYFRMKLDIHNRFKNNKKNKGVSKHNIIQYNFINNTNTDFSDYLLKFYSYRIYNEWKTKGFEKLNYVYRFENLQKDFSTVLRKLKLKQVRKLPHYNKTPLRTMEFEKYYSPKAKRLAKTVFTKYMRKWGYAFPAKWKSTKALKAQQIFITLLYPIQLVFHQILDHPQVYKRYYKDTISFTKNLLK